MAIGNLILGLILGGLVAAFVYWVAGAGLAASIVVFIVSANIAALLAAVLGGRRK